MVGSKAAVTVLRSPDEVRQLWQSPEYRPRYIDGPGVAVSFEAAPGDRGTEIYVDLQRAAPGGKLGEAVLKLFGSAPLAKVQDDLRRFKQRVEAGEVARSDGAPAGEAVERKLKQRPAQPLPDSELAKAGV